MTSADERVQYLELFRLIEDYASRGLDYQVKALSLIRDNFTPFDHLPIQQTKDIVEHILSRNNYLIWYGGRPSITGVDTIVVVGSWSNDRDWGFRLLVRMLRRLIDPDRPWYGLHLPSPSSSEMGTGLTDDIAAILQGMRSLEGRPAQDIDDVLGSY